MPLCPFSKCCLAQPNEIDNLNHVVYMGRIVCRDQRVFDSLSYDAELSQLFDSQLGHSRAVLVRLNDKPYEKPLLLVRVMVHHPMRSKRNHSTTDIVHPSCSSTTPAILLCGYCLAPFLIGQARHAVHRSEFKV